MLDGGWGWVQLTLEVPLLTMVLWLCLGFCQLRERGAFVEQGYSVPARKVQGKSQPAGNRLFFPILGHDRLDQNCL